MEVYSWDANFLDDFEIFEGVHHFQQTDFLLESRLIRSK